MIDEGSLVGVEGEYVGRVAVGASAQRAPEASRPEGKRRKVRVLADVHIDTVDEKKFILGRLAVNFGHDEATSHDNRNRVGVLGQHDGRGARDAVGIALRTGRLVLGLLNEISSTDSNAECASKLDAEEGEKPERFFVNGEEVEVIGEIRGRK